MLQQGIPANTNPFCINTEYDMCDGALEQYAPTYFGTGKDYDNSYHTYAKKHLVVTTLSQTEAEALFIHLVGLDVVDCLVVQEQFKHIIPKDWPKEVWITKCTGETCFTLECYKFKANGA